MSIFLSTGKQNFIAKCDTNMLLLITPSGQITESLLTVREQAVMELLGKGLRQRQIAEQLSIKPETARTHTKNAYKKLNAHNKVDALRKAGIWQS